jgi:peptidoglycan hydrolase-like amidase
VRAVSFVLSAVVVLSAGSAAYADDPPVHQETTYNFPSNDAVTIVGRGHGSGRGLAEYGAERMAEQGRTAAQILDFYYPGTAAGTLADTATVRVRLSGHPGNVGFPSTSVGVMQAPDLQVRDDATGSVTLLDDMFRAYRVVRSGAEEALQGQDATGAWVPVPLAGGATAAGPLTFSGPEQLRLLWFSGVQVAFPGAITALPGPGSSLITVNTVSVRDYLYSALSEQLGLVLSVPAQQALAIAMRSYVQSLRETAGADWDLIAAGPESRRYKSFIACRDRDLLAETSPCLEYAGFGQYSNGTLNRRHELPSAVDAVNATAGQVRTYAGAVISGQFTESNGGWTVADPARPYLVAKADPVSATEPTWTAPLRPAAVGSDCSPQLTDADRFAVLGRDGRGDWGGRVTLMRVDGRTASQTRISPVLGGDGLLRCLRATDVDSTWFRVTTAPARSIGLSPVYDASGLLYLAGTDSSGIGLTHYQGGGSFGIGVGGATQETPAAIRLPNGNLRVFAVGLNHALYSHDEVRPGSGPLDEWHSWGGSIVGRPAPVFMPDHSIGVYTQGANGRVYAAVFAADGGFRGWTNLGGPALAPGTGPGAASTGSGGVMMAVNGGATGVWVRAYRPGVGWGGWTNINGSAFGSLAAGSPAAGVFDVYATNAAASPTARDIRTRRFSGGAWGPWHSVSGQTYEAPGVVTNRGATVLVAIGLDFTPFQRVRAANGTWGPWQRLFAR